MNVLIVEPGKVPREAEIGDASKSKQAVVGGWLQILYPHDNPVAIVYNGEGKSLGMPLNRKLDDFITIAGTFFICGLDDKYNFASLSPKLMEKFKQKFAQPEIFMQSGDRIEAFPVKLVEEVSQARKAKPIDREER